MAPVDSRDYVLSGMYYSVLEPRRRAKLNVACQYSQQILRRWPSIKPALAQRLVLAGIRSIAAGLVVLTAGGDYKPTPTQCLVNVGPASPVLASIHSALVSTSCWRYQHDALNKSWANAVPSSATPAHFHRGAEHAQEPNTGLMLAQHRRRRANTSPESGQRLVFAGAACDYTM